MGWQAKLPLNTVPDLDAKNGANGIENWHRLCEEHDYDIAGLDDLPCVRTPSGGLHYYFEGALDKNVIGAFYKGSGIDIVNNPNLPGTPGYEWELPINQGWPEPLPEWALGRTPQKGPFSLNELFPDEPPRPGVLGSDDPLAMPEKGERNNGLIAHLGGVLRQQAGISWDDLLQEAVNFNNLLDDPLSFDEVSSVARSSLRYREEAKSTAAPIDTGLITMTAEGLLKAAEEDIITPLLGPFKSGEFGVIAARGGVGKSMFSMGLAQAFGSGNGFGTWENDGGPLGVLVMDAENRFAGLKPRIMAHGAMPNVEFSTFQMWPEFKADLGSAAWQDLLKARIEDSGAKVVILDNYLNLVMRQGSGSGWSPETWEQFSQFKLWCWNNDVLCILIHHLNRDGGSYGEDRMNFDCEFFYTLDAIPEEEQHVAKIQFRKKHVKHRGNEVQEFTLDEDWWFDDGSWHSSVPKTPTMEAKAYLTRFKTASLGELVAHVEAVCDLGYKVGNGETGQGGKMYQRLKKIRQRFRQDVGL
ncbi:MAG: AAA family ATPase [Halieaceae bacterium]|nr:AAA family ATPase [Halieaceae bacterium]